MILNISFCIFLSSVHLNIVILIVCCFFPLTGFVHCPGGSVTSPLLPRHAKVQAGEYRYGREEMLALYIKDNKVPEDMQDKEFAAILQDEPMQPLALVPLTEEEGRKRWSR
uniref:GRB10 interacting GYF protein 1a n=1 Tax=Salarias fasciatus TaxID=181472 RepID=A0A672FIC3_SALFA